jgi:hypothetical protein
MEHAAVGNERRGILAHMSEPAQGHFHIALGERGNVFLNMLVVACFPAHLAGVCNKAVESSLKGRGAGVLELPKVDG